MNWLIFVIIAVLFDASRVYTDNYISDVYFKGNGAASQKMFYLIFHFVLAIALLIIFGVDFSIAPASTFIFLIISGFLSSIAGIFYYKTLEIDNSTNLGIFYQLAPILYLVFGFFFFGESISPLQLVAFFIILAAPVLIILSVRKRSRKTTFRAIGFAFIFVLISVIGNLIFVRQSTSDLPFVTAMTFMFIGKSLGNAVIMLIYRKWIRRFNSVLKSSKKRVLRPLILSGTLNTVKDFTYRAALSFAPSIALASATADSSEPIVMFFMGLVLTLIAPKLGREKLTKKSVLVHLVATVLVVVGIILIQQ